MCAYHIVLYTHAWVDTDMCVQQHMCEGQQTTSLAWDSLSVCLVPLTTAYTDELPRVLVFPLPLQEYFSFLKHWGSRHVLICPVSMDSRASKSGLWNTLVTELFSILRALTFIFPTKTAEVETFNYHTYYPILFIHSYFICKLGSIAA